MYPQYSYKYQKKCVDLYRQGKWPETPEGVKEKRFYNIFKSQGNSNLDCPFSKINGNTNRNLKTTIS